MSPVELVVHEAGAGEPVVLLHGLGSRGADWGLQVPVLATRHRVLAPDLRGHGRSPAPPGSWTLPEFAADVIHLVRQQVGGPVHVVGLSLGGMVVFEMLRAAPELVLSAVIINSGPAFPGRTWLGRSVIWWRLLMLRWKGLPALGAAISWRLFPKPEQEELRQRFMDGIARNDPTAYVRTLRAIQHFDASSVLGDVRVPVLAISGDRDYTPVAAKAAWVRQVPGARLEVIPDSGHATPMDQPEALNAALLNFLAGSSSPLLT